MSMVSEHYENLLAEYYSWMFGDYQARVASAHEFFTSAGIRPLKTKTAVDLGAGSGFQSMALAQLGFDVLSVDLSQKLLAELKNNSGMLPITTVRDDMLNFRNHCSGSVEVCVCMGDTLTHLESFERVRTLFGSVYEALAPDGTFIATFRDLTTELKGTDRFIPVRSDANTIFTCFLEYGPDYVQVHDLVYAKKGDRWDFRKSSYRKLRLPFDWTVQRLKEAGFTLRTGRNDKGMITIVAGKRG